MERSIGHTETHELAVMVDTFRPLMVTEEAMGLDDGQYYKSWVSNKAVSCCSLYLFCSLKRSQKIPSG
jgi:homogentisate 1,2-dioxygenase